MARADVILGVCSSAGLQYNGGGTNYVIQKTGSPATFYQVFVDNAADVMYSKSIDGGFTWSVPVNVFTGTIVALSVFYDRWSGIAADIIHIAYTASDHIIRYRSLDIASDTLGTEATVFTGVSTTTNGALTIWRSRGTDTIRVAGSIDNGAEDGAWSSTDGGATWTDTIADPSEGGGTDQYFGLPGWNADANDEMIIFVDASANGLSVKRYDDSANSWAETAIIADASYVDSTPGNHFPHLACAVDIANSRNIVASWTQIDTANADLRLFFINDTTITESAANVVLNSADDQGSCAVGLNTETGRIYVFYTGKSDGSDTFYTATKVYCKYTDDDGATWSAETQVSYQVRSTAWIACTPRFTRDWIVAWLSDQVADLILVSVQFPFSPRARYQIGM